MVTAVKICGITRVEDGHAAALAGAHAIGLVFHAASALRYYRARQGYRAAAASFVTAVGLFVDAPAEQVPDPGGATSTSAVPWRRAAGLLRRVPCTLIKAIRMKAGVDLLQCAGRYASAKGLLLDACVDGVAGGTGESFDWDLIPRAIALPIVLAGGLTPGNVGAAVRRVRPWAVDVSSGVEREKGIKDAAAIAAFIRGARDADV